MEVKKMEITVIVKIIVTIGIILFLAKERKDWAETKKRNAEYKSKQENNNPPC
jgi:Na+/H+ antiporter NhaD/arsenite permease-like protein